MSEGAPKLSIIIPVGPGDCIDIELGRFLEAAASRCEVIVSTASGDSVATPAGSTCVPGTTGRAAQVNRGVAHAGGDWLWILHADSRPEQDGLPRVIDFIRESGPSLGYGRLRFLPDGPWLTRFNAWGAAIRCRVVHLPYGDQGLCIPKKEFQRLNGFNELLQRGEDLDFVVRAREAGLPVRAMPLDVHTSARRYRQNGWLKTTWEHQLASIRLVRNARRASRSDTS